MKLRARINCLEGNRPQVEAGSLLALDLPDGLCARIAASQAAGTFPQSLAFADLEAIVAAADEAQGKT